MAISLNEQTIERWDDDGGNPAKSPGTQGTNPMDYFTAKTFQIPQLKGISPKNLKQHLELYAGYIKFSNQVMKQIAEIPRNDESKAYELSLLQRRFAYEFDGMRNHEAFFEQFEGVAAACSNGGPFIKQVVADFGTLDALINCLKGVATTRGIGWVMLYYCSQSGHIFPQWVDEHHSGLLSGPKLVLALDMWEHAFVYDYSNSEKKKYVDAFFENLNWGKVEARFGKQ